MTDTWVQMKIRLPLELHKWFKEKAKGNYRPMNSELIALLEKEKNSRKEAELEASEQD